MPSLEKIVKQLAIDADSSDDKNTGENFIHPDFRLLLSSMPTDVFPVSVSTQTTCTENFRDTI